MKLSIQFILSTLFLVLTSCSSTKLVQVPFSASQYQTDNQFIRATGMGTHVNKQMAGTIALNKAREALAGQIRTVVEQRITELNRRDGEQLELSMFEKTTKVIVEENLDNYEVLDQKTIRKDDGASEVWTVLQMPRSVIDQKLNTVLSH